MSDRNERKVKCGKCGTNERQRVGSCEGMCIENERRERERNPAQLKHARPTPLSEVYLGTSGGIHEPLRKHWTHFPKVPKRILQWCLQIQPIAQGTGCLNPSSIGQHVNLKLLRLQIRRDRNIRPVGEVTLCEVECHWAKRAQEARHERHCAPTS